VGALRPEGDGGKRSLICSLRAACGEEDPHKLAVYSAKEFDSMRMEDFYFVQPAQLQAKKDALNKKLAEAGKPQLK
jgi:hypothetical protein